MPDWESACKNEARNGCRFQAQAIQLRKRVDRLEDILEEIVDADQWDLCEDHTLILKAEGILREQQ